MWSDWTFVNKSHQYRQSAVVLFLPFFFFYFLELRALSLLVLSQCVGLNLCMGSAAVQLVLSAAETDGTS